VGGRFGWLATTVDNIFVKDFDAFIQRSQKGLFFFPYNAFYKCLLMKQLGENILKLKSEPGYELI